MTQTGQDIHNAIQALPNQHGTVLLDADVYVIYETLTIPEGVYVRGQGEWATQLFRAPGVDCDMVWIGSADAPYRKFCGLFDLRLHGNAAKTSAGNGLVVSRTWHCRVGGVRIQDVPGWALQVLRSYWGSFQDMHIWKCGNGVLLGSGEGHLYSNSTRLSNVHVENKDRTGIGIHIANANSTLLEKCDTSSCEIGVLIETVSGGSGCEMNSLVNHHFESNKWAIVNRQGVIPGVWRNYLAMPRFGANDVDIVDEEGTLRVLR